MDDLDATVKELRRSIFQLHKRPGEGDLRADIEGIVAAARSPLGFMPELTVEGALEAIPEVESCYGVAGDEAFVVQVRVASVDHLHRCIGRLRAIDGVARTRTTVVLATRFEHRPTRDSDPLDVP